MVEKKHSCRSALLHFVTRLLLNNTFPHKYHGRKLKIGQRGSFMNAVIHHRGLASSSVQSRPNSHVASQNHPCEFNGFQTHGDFVTALIRTRGSVDVAIIPCIHKLGHYSGMSTSHLFFFFFSEDSHVVKKLYIVLER